MPIRSGGCAAAARAFHSASLVSDGDGKGTVSRYNCNNSGPPRQPQALAHDSPPGTRATRPAGGYFLWIELPDRVDALHLHRLALSQGISVPPGPTFPAHPRFNNVL